MRLSKEEYMPIAPSSPGEQVHVNHEGCSAGRDTKQRLYIKRLHNGAVVAWCHHCSSGGYSKEGIRNIHSYGPKTTVTTNNEVRLPKDIEFDVMLWPREARVWPLKYGIEIKELEEYRIGFSPTIDRVVLPVYTDGKLIAYQARAVSPGSEPKYLTSRIKEVKNPIFSTGTTQRKETVVLTEDMLSAIKVSRYVDARALLGVYIDIYDIYILSNIYNNIIILLDNDNTEVRKQQLRISQLCNTMFSGRVAIGRLDKDPKELSDSEIKETIDVCLQ